MQWTEWSLALAPTAVAFVALGNATRQQRRGFEHERYMDARDDARRLVDDAALALAKLSERLIEETLARTS